MRGMMMLPDASARLREAVRYAFADVAVMHRGSVRQRILDVAEAELLCLALRLNDGNRIHAAKMLGISRNTLAKRVRSLGVGDG